MVQNPVPTETAAERAAEERRSERKREILRAAAGVFRAKGYHGAGMRDIAAALGVAPGALYYYFPSKEDLLEACQRLSLARLLAVGEALLVDERSADLRLRDLVRAHLRSTLEEMGGSAAHLEVRALAGDRFAAVVAERDRYERIIRRLIEAGIAEGCFAPVDARLSTFSLLGSLNWTVMWWRPGGGLPVDELADGITQLFIQGLSPRRGAPPENAEDRHA